jgi:hypothetical protein
MLSIFGVKFITTVMTGLMGLLRRLIGRFLDFIGDVFENT